MFDLLHPNLLALMAAFWIAAARTLYQGAMTRFGAGFTATLSSVITLHFAWGFYFTMGRLDVWPIRGVLWFMVVGVMGGLAGRYLSFYSMKAVGMARTSVLLQTSVIWSSTLAIVFLGERMTFLVGLGTVTIMIGAILLVHKGERVQREVSPVLYLVPLGAAFFQGMSHLFRKFGFFWISSAPLGMSIGNSMAVLSLLVVLPFTKERVPLRWERSPLLMIFLGAVCNAMAAICFWTAVRRGDLVLVIPINRLSILMMIFASWLFFQKQEAITWRVVAGGVLSITGACAIALG